MSKYLKPEEVYEIIESPTLAPLLRSKPAIRATVEFHKDFMWHVFPIIDPAVSLRNKMFSVDLLWFRLCIEIDIWYGHKYWLADEEEIYE